MERKDDYLERKKKHCINNLDGWNKIMWFNIFLKAPFFLQLASSYKLSISFI